MYFVSPAWVIHIPPTNAKLMAYPRKSGQPFRAARSTGAVIRRNSEIEHEQRNHDREHSIGERVETIERLVVRSRPGAFIVDSDWFLFGIHTISPIQDWH